MQRDGIKGECDILMKTKKVQNGCSMMGRWGEGREEQDVKSKQWPVSIEPRKSS